MSKTISLSFLSLLTFSCAAAPTSVRGFAAPPDAVRKAVQRSLAGCEDVRQEEGRFVTGWAPAAPSGDEQGPVLGHEYVYRACHEVTVVESKVSVTSRAERRAPGGPRSIRWERIDPAPFSRALLDAVEKDLEGSK
jgi:hypothetical protein